MSARVLLVSMVGALMLAGCGSAPERAATIGPQTGPAAAKQTPVAPKPKGAGDALSLAQVKSALLSVADMPTGWAQEKNTPDDNSKATIQPASCQKMFDDMDSKTSGKKARVKDKVSFSQGGMLGAQLEVEVASFAADNQGDKVEGLAKALTKCSTIKSTKGGETIELTMAGLSFPNLGDQTLALRATGKTAELTVIVDMVFVATGHNIVSFTAAGLQPLPGAELEKIARAGMAKVATAARS